MYLWVLIYVYVNCFFANWQSIDCDYFSIYIELIDLQFINETWNWLTKVYRGWSRRLHVFLQIQLWVIISSIKHTRLKMIDWVTQKLKFLLHLKLIGILKAHACLYLLLFSADYFISSPKRRQIQNRTWAIAYFVNVKEQIYWYSSYKFS